MITELRTLSAVVRYGTFAAAGARIGLTQAAVSGQMRRLEDKLGVRLFDRTGRSAILNQTGRTVLARAQEVLAGVEKLTEPLDSSTQTGRLRIGAISSVQPTILRRALKAFHPAFPGFYIEIVPGTSLELLDRLDAGGLDVAVIIRPGFGLPPTVRWESLVQERFVLVAPPGTDDMDWKAAMRGHAFLRYNRHSFGGRLVERLIEQQGVLVDEWVEIDDIAALLSMVADGMGVAIVPRAEAYADHFRGVRVIELGEAETFREIGILTSPTCDEPAARFISECRQAVSADKHE
ncbi:MAG: LysR family transcriptional regulator [Mesorhizobium sp.]|uniref:LysR substrate-binding domain-containing protein n=1 Tax=Mesorhizobium sp. TaxID=1871066 RepID=UPI000FE59E44|nr:LysR substrate-binding domain-containing protein [Mesorhizobium sp.]RWN01200.1 MAG: LysR family transcriptional regulator [Mesorhizobium sp.]